MGKEVICPDCFSVLTLLKSDKTAKPKQIFVCTNCNNFYGLYLLTLEVA